MRLEGRFLEQQAPHSLQGAHHLLTFQASGRKTPVGPSAVMALLPQAHPRPSLRVLAVLALPYCLCPLHLPFSQGTQREARNSL